MRSISQWVNNHWPWLALVALSLAPRLYLLRVYDLELSEDGFDAVNMLATFQTRGLSAIPREGITRFVLHPLYMFLLYVLRVLTPTSIDFYIAARLFSAVIGCAAVVLMYEFVRREFNAPAAWVAAVLLAFAPSFLWESVAILSSTLFLVLYMAVLSALARSSYRWAGVFALVAAVTRAEGAALVAFVFLVALVEAVRKRRFDGGMWLWLVACALLVPATILGSSVFATGNPLAFVGAQSISTIWLRFLAPGDFFSRGAFFLTQYPALFPLPVVLIGIAGAIAAVVWHRGRATVLLLGLAALYVLFFEALVWFDYTTLEVRFLMYPGLPLLVFAAVALADARKLVLRAAAGQAGAARAAVAATKARRWIVDGVLGMIVVVLLGLSYRQGDAGMRFIYNMMASQREVADELARLIPPDHATNLMVYTGNEGALDLFGRQRGLELSFVDFRFAPDTAVEQFLIDNKIQFVVYPVGNAFAKAKYPYLARFEPQTHNGVEFRPIVQFSTSTDNQLYSIWALKYTGGQP
jgi:hypothetical protein